LPDSAQIRRLEAEIGESADVDVVDVGMAADFFVGRDEDFAPCCAAKLPAADRIDVGADGYAETDVPVGKGVLVGDGSGSDYSDSHDLLFSWGGTLIIMRVHR
jgi:hypothetical protein